MRSTILKGAVAGAAGTMALDAASYADMALRGRPGSTIMADTVQKLAERAGGGALATADDEATKNRRTALGSLGGYGVGVGIGVLYGLARPGLRARVPLLVAGATAGLAAMAATDGAIIGLGATDPKTWGVAGWVSDLVPHLLYGVALAAVYEALTDGSP